MNKILLLSLLISVILLFCVIVRFSKENYTNVLVSDVYGNITTFDLVPRGTIAIWTKSTIPNGWALCNGLNGTPDLQDRFIKGGGLKPETDTIVIGKAGEKGGRNKFKLAIEDLPSHTHSNTISSNCSTDSQGSHTHTASTNSAGNHRHAYTIASSYNVVDTPDGKDDTNMVGDCNDTTSTAAGNHIHVFTSSEKAAHTHIINTKTCTIVNTDTGKDSDTITEIDNQPPYYVLSYIMKL